MGNFTINNNKLVSYEGNDRIVTIPSSVSRIGSGAFKDKTIEEIHFEGSSLKSIDEEAFANCKKLKSMLIPYGTVQIGDRAFAGCKTMQYIRIPSSVLLVGDDILSDHGTELVIIGEKGTEAEQVAEKYHVTLQVDEARTIQAIEAAHKGRSGAKTRTFEILGETIICSNTLAKYQAAIEYYASRKDPFFKEYYRQFPQTLTTSTGDVVKVLESEVQRTVERLAGHGVLITKEKIQARYLYNVYTMTKDSLEMLIKFQSELANAAVSDIESMKKQLANEAENKVTGLSYGILGDGLDLLAYSIDDFRERQRQRKAAYAEANQKFDQYRSSHLSQGEKMYADILAQISPSLQKIADYCIEQLCKAEVDLLTESGIIEENALNGIDTGKSAQLIQSIADRMGENSFTAVLAIKKYPCNVAALTYVIEHNPSCEQAKELTDFLGLTKRVKQGLQTSRQNRINEYVKYCERALTARQGVTLITKEKDLLAEGDIIRMLESLARAITPKILDIAYGEKEYVITYTEAYCCKELSNILSEDDWDFFEKYGVQPVCSREVPDKALIAYSFLVDWLSDELTQRMEKKQILNKYLAKYPLANKKDSLLQQRNNLIKERDAKKHISAKGAKIFLFTLGLINLVISIICFIISYNLGDGIYSYAMGGSIDVGLFAWTSLIFGLGMFIPGMIMLLPKKEKKDALAAIRKKMQTVDNQLKEIETYPTFEEWKTSQNQKR